MLRRTVTYLLTYLLTYYLLTLFVIVLCYAGDVAVGVVSSAVAGDMASLAVAEAASLAGS